MKYILVIGFCLLSNFCAYSLPSLPARFVGASEEDTNVLFKKIFDTANETFFSDTLPITDPLKNKWAMVVNEARRFVEKNNNDLIEARFFKVFDERNNSLLEIMAKKAHSISDIMALDGIVSSLEGERRKLEGIAEKIRKERFTNASERYAAEVMAILLNCLQIAAANLAIKLSETAYSQSPEGLAPRTENIQKSAAKYNQKAQKLGSKAVFLDKIKKAASPSQSADKEYQSLLQEINKQITFDEIKTIIEKVDGFARKYNKESLSLSPDIKKYKLFDLKNQAATKILSAKEGSAKIKSSFFTSREKRYPYELYEKVWEKIGNAKS